MCAFDETQIRMLVFRRRREEERIAIARQNFPACHGSDRRFPLHREIDGLLDLPQGDSGTVEDKSLKLLSGFIPMEPDGKTRKFP